MRPRLFDSHMHTPLCKHAEGDPIEYAQKALELGLTGITFTCHGPMPDRFWPEVRMDHEQLPEYVSLVEAARAQFEGLLEVRLGLESDFFPGYESWAESLHQEYDFEYILGSVHFQGVKYRENFFHGSVMEFRKTYFDHLAQSAETGLFDCLSHPDLIKNVAPHEWRWNEIEDVVAEALDRIAKTGVAMELNTSGRNKSYQEFNPGTPMLKMMRERNIPVVLGSDSHVSHRVGDAFDEALHALEEAGYEEISYFTHRQRQVIPLAEAKEAARLALDSLFHSYEK